MSESLKMLICSPFPLKREMGAPKVLIEVAEELRKLGWKIDLVDQEGMKSPDPSLPYQDKLKRYLRENVHKYDVVEYDHEYLPYSRKEFPQGPLFVARSVLLALHYRHVDIPQITRKRDLVLNILRPPRPPVISEERYSRTLRTLKQADLLNLSTSKDLLVLQEEGIDAQKAVVLPYGLSEDLVQAYESVPLTPPQNPVVAFVGTFDERKGGADLPYIFARIEKRVPRVRFKLLGTAGLFQSADQVKSLFPFHLRKWIEVLPQYETRELPGLLADCSVGVFPSYLEGFGFAVLEMLAAGLPVAAYNVPGPCDIVAPDFLAEPGDRDALADRLVGLLKNPESLAQERIKARKRSGLFRWNKIAADTDRAYRDALKAHRALPGNSP